MALKLLSDPPIMNYGDKDRRCSGWLPGMKTTASSHPVIPRFLSMVFQTRGPTGMTAARKIK